MTEQSCLIIGAGMAELWAANYLKPKGLSPIILEASDRVGGRVWTDHSLGFLLNMGAAWLHGLEHNPIAELAKALELPWGLPIFAQAIC